MQTLIFIKRLFLCILCYILYSEIVISAISWLTENSSKIM